MTRLNLALILLVLPLLASSAIQDAPPVGKPDSEDDKVKYEKVVIAEKEFKLELAADFATRAKGLSGREKLDKDKGMLFVYPRNGIRSFWMYECLIDIDILYLDSRGRIVSGYAMKKEAPRGERETQGQYEGRLKRYPSKRWAQYVIELKAGTIKKLKLKAGQTITLDFRRLSRLARD